MQRYGVFSVSGFLTPVVGGNFPTPTVWYVTDDAFCAEIVYRSRHEHQARREAIRLNGIERKWEKEQQRALNGT